MKDSDLDILREITLSMKQENCRLRTENFSLAEKVRKLETGNFDESYIFTTSKTALPAGGIVTVDIKIPKECDFLTTKLIKSGSNFEFQIYGPSNDRAWSNAPLDCEVVPLILPKPRFVARDTTLKIKLINKLQDGPGHPYWNEVSVALVGYKTYFVEM